MKLGFRPARKGAHRFHAQRSFDSDPAIQGLRAETVKRSDSRRTGGSALYRPMKTSRSPLARIDKLA
jgi:hypothetical protein